MSPLPIEVNELDRETKHARPLFTQGLRGRAAHLLLNKVCRASQMTLPCGLDAVTVVNWPIIAKFW